MRRVGIKMRKYITCENRPERNHVVKMFFAHKCKETQYVALGDVEGTKLNKEFITSLVKEAGTNGLFISGGSPCDDLAGTNRHRMGIGGKKSVLFFDFNRVVYEATQARMQLDRQSAKRREEAWLRDDGTGGGGR